MLTAKCNSMFFYLHYQSISFSLKKVDSNLKGEISIYWFYIKLLDILQEEAMRLVCDLGLSHDDAPSFVTIVQSDIPSPVPDNRSYHEIK